MALKIAEEEEKRMFHEMNEQQRLRAEQRHLDDKRQMKERREAMVRVLDQQVCSSSGRLPPCASERLLQWALYAPSQWCYAYSYA